MLEVTMPTGYEEPMTADPRCTVRVNVLRQVDDRLIHYVRHCTEDELDGVIAGEQDLPGSIVKMNISPPSD